MGVHFMFLLHEYDIFWTFLIIASLIPILPVSEGPEKLSSYESGIEPMGGAWLQFRIRYYMFALVLFFDVLGVSVFIEAFIFIPIGFFCAEKERKEQGRDQDNAAGLTLQIKAGDWDSIAVILYVYGYNYLRSQCAYDSLPKRIILESRLFSGDNKFMFTYTTQFQILFKASFLFSNLENHIFCLEIYLLTLEIYLLTLD
ncbi:hypothetical protein ACJX0J_002592 [Zea mays]